MLHDIWHWFDLCKDARVRVRLSQNTSGWTLYYTDTGVDRNYPPVCLGPSYIRPQMVVTRS